MEWTEYKIKEIINHFQNGYAFKASKYTDIGIPIISMQSISLDGEFQLNEKNNYWDAKEKDKLKNFILRKGDLIMSMTDVTPQRNLIGCSTIIDIEGVFFLNQRVGKLEMNKGVVDVNFIDYYFKSSYWRNYCRSISSLSVQANIGTRDIKNGKIRLPEKPEQTAIATILSKVNEAIEATQNGIKSAEKLKKALMQNLLSGKLKPDGTWRKDDEFYVDEKFGKVPNGWEVKKVKDCFDFYPTASYSRSQLIENGEFNYIHYGDIHTKFDRILDIDKQGLPFIPNDLRKKYELLKDGDLVISDASEDWEGVGKSIELINIRDKKIISGLHTLHLRPKSDDFIQGIKGYILNIHKVSIGIKRLATGMKVYGISKPNLGRVYLPIPTEPEQRLIKKTLDECSDDIFEKQNKIKTLQRLKKSLMQNLLTGKVRVDVEEINKILSEQ